MDDRRLATHANVVLTSTGLLVPGRWDRPPIRVTMAHLAAMAVLSSPAAARPHLLDDLASDVALPAIEAAAAELGEAGLLVDLATSARGALAATAPSLPPGAPRLARGRRRLVTPVVLHPRDGRFEVVDGAGDLVASWGPRQVLVLERFRVADDVDSVAGAAEVLGPLEGTAWIEEAEHLGATSPRVQYADRLRQVEQQRVQRFVEVAERDVESYLEAAASHPGGRRTPVYPVSHPVQYPNTALGLIFAYAQQYEGGRLWDHYDLTPVWSVRRSNVRRLLEERGPGVFLFSNYLWSSESNLALSRLVKELSPESVTIHGGPNTPRYERDADDFLREHPHVDVVARNEGELTVAEILDALGGDVAGAASRRHLRDVAGIAFLLGDEVVRTPDRDRVSALDELPSPFLSGTFHTYEESSAPLVVLETNRGCPYGCTFCDWGSSTLSRIRQFSLERVFAELDWLAQHEMERVFVADSNFGIFARDIEIAEHVAHLRRTTGYPREFQTSYAKNTVKHLEKIIRVLVDAGITTEGLLSLQTNDESTLEAIERKNIKTSKYLELAATFRRERLPLFTDLMVGLPGSSYASFADDLQFTIDHEVPARVFRTELLVNSPMNDPAYRERYDIKIEGGETRELAGQVGRRRKSLVLSTSTFTAEDLHRAMDLRALYALCENYGILRHVARFVRQSLGVREIDLYQRLHQRVMTDGEAYPTVRWAFTTMGDVAAPPVSWRWFFDEVRRYLVDEVGVADDSALDAVLAVQRALVPDRGRTFPETVQLQHDYVAWFERQMMAKEAGHDWVDVVPPLATFGPGRLDVSDPTNVCVQSMGRAMDLTYYGHWELDSPVSRTMPHQHLTV